MPLTKAELLNRDATPAWTGPLAGVGEVSVREISGDDFDYIQGKPGEGVDRRELMARMVVAGVCDETGKALFGRNETAAVNAMPFRKLKLLAGAVQDHGGITDEDVEDAEGNSRATTPDASGTD